MSTRHLAEIQHHLGDVDPWRMPTREILALPDNLHLCQTPYDPCAFGTPGGAPRMLGIEYPVVVEGKYTYVYVADGSVCAYFKLEAKK